MTVEQEAATQPLAGQVALVAGATRGAGRGMARMLAAAGALVYCTGRSARGAPSATPGRPETIDETAEMIAAEGGRAVPLRVDHTREEEVESLAARVREEAGKLDVLVNDIWGGDRWIDWEQRFWELDLANARALIDRAVLTHLVTARHLAPLMIEQDRGLIVEVTDGHHPGYRGQILYDLVKSAVARIAYGMAMELAQTNVTALAVTPGFLRSEAVLEHFGVQEANWRDAIAKDPFFAESETPCFVGRAVAALAADPDVRAKAGLTLFATDLAEEYGFTDIDGRRPRFCQAFDAHVAELARSEEPLDEMGRFFVWSRYCQIHQEPERHEQAVMLAKRLGLKGVGAGVEPSRPYVG